MLLERLNENDLLSLEIEKHPTREMVIALIKKLRENIELKDEAELKLDTLEETLEEAEIDI